MSIGEIISYIIFLAMGSFGIYVHMKEENYLIIIGSIGIILLIIVGIVDNIVDRKKWIVKELK